MEIKLNTSMLKYLQKTSKYVNFKIRNERFEDVKEGYQKPWFEEGQTYRQKAKQWSSSRNAENQSLNNTYPTKTGVDVVAPEGLTVPAHQVLPVVLLMLQKEWYILCKSYSVWRCQRRLSDAVIRRRTNVSAKSQAMVVASHNKSFSNTYPTKTWLNAGAPEE